ncbi:hypothetical protein [Dyadobacter luticola]|uniref:hypothetical protein n=1 Tax=Dyadobacter luticola TaxID=1979387 RepID=UPI001E4FB719|nr:hypothetical protein [Dyadobacter luticola]
MTTHSQTPTLKSTTLTRFFARLSIFTAACFLLNCASGIPISTGTKYPIEVLYDNALLERPYSEIGVIEISSEDSLTAEQTSDKRMMQRGNDAKTKELLTARLVMKAQKIGADALINVKYKYYTTVKKEGYMLSGLAVRYRGE